MEFWGCATLPDRQDTFCPCQATDEDDQEERRRTIAQITWIRDDRRQAFWPAMIHGKT